MSNESIEIRFALRLATLRKNAGISARDMSLTLGQNPGYINNIEKAKVFPSMVMFFKICEYLKVTPAEFFQGFDGDDSAAAKIHGMVGCLNEEQVEALCAVVRELVKTNEYN